MRSFRPYPMPFAVLALLAAVALCPAAGFAQEAAEPAVEGAEAAQPPFLGDFLIEVDRVQTQIFALAEAMPQEVFNWRPAEGVRSAGEVYLHIAFGNYGLLAVSGHAPPAEVADQIAVDKIRAWDTSTTDKAAITAKLSSSFDHLRSTVSGLGEADLETPVDFFGQTPTKRQMLLLLLGHLHEHLGQQIAYARMNGVAPPWTAAQQEAMRRAAEAQGGDGG